MSKAEHPYAADYAPGFQRNSGEVAESGAQTVGEFAVRAIEDYVGEKRLEALEERVDGISDRFGRLLDVVENIVDLLISEREPRT